MGEEETELIIADTQKVDSFVRLKMKNKEQEINYWKFVLTGTFSVFLIPIIETGDFISRLFGNSGEFFVYRFTKWLLK